ncbi:hypothetical protein BRADI_2g22770v3 [Brachypodium distachyon]|uniref:Mitochondrial import inner membrane translocase subunit TIM50 n=1 Tax=Brachypodium distachyon TaxID=15368 RepID=A0A0Q3IJ64_BRADI|nr:hypothetical protein BRADI_2g22770v3 [Brachypodium distachyon]
MAAAVQHRGHSAWQVMAVWLGFLLQILLQAFRRSSSSVARLLSFLGLRRPLLSAAPAVTFVQLPSEAPADELPPPPPPYPPLGRLTVVLDLDETLVCAYESSSLPATVHAQAIEAGLHCFDMEDADGRRRVNHVTVFERPGLHAFLQQTTEFADLILFTAGLEGYARPLVDRIDAHNRFCHRLYRPSTVTTFLLQPLNGIPCLTFSAGQPMDDQLMGVVFPLLKHLSLQKDVRPALYDTFHMPEWFQRHGIPQIVQAA